MVKVVIQADPKYSINKLALQQAVTQTLNTHNIKSNTEVEICIVGDRKMQQLNKDYRGINSTTDILTFALQDPHQGAGFISYPDKVLRLGSIVISINQAFANAAEEGKSLEQELIFLTIHGTKHLLGIHHD